MTQKETSSAWPERVHCPHGEDCGACAFLDLQYGQQLRRKEQLLLGAMGKLRGGLDDKMRPCLPSPHVAGYRNRARMAVGFSRHRGVELGYFRESSREIVDAPDCRVLIPEVLQTTRSFRRLLDSKSRAFPRELRHIDVRCGSDPRRQHLILVVRKDQAPRLPVEMIRKACRNVDGISINLNTSKGPQVLKGPIEHLWGAREVFVETHGVRLRVSPGSFFQVNLALLPQIHHAMAEFLGQGECLADLYSGVGTHGVALREQFQRLVFVEGVRAAVADTKATLKRFSIDRAKVVAKPVERATKQLLEARADACVMNPSRAGADAQVLETLAASSIRRLVYLSCNPVSLARDLDTLREHGFGLHALQPIDMMPQTRHVEAMAFLSRS